MPHRRPLHLVSRRRAGTAAWASSCPLQLPCHIGTFTSNYSAAAKALRRNCGIHGAAQFAASTAPHSSRCAGHQLAWRLVRR